MSLWVIGTCGEISAQPPQEGLAMAQQAEKLVASNKTNEAISVLEAASKKFPTVNAFNLRIAQIYDNQNQYGPALFYYRKYVNSGGGKGLEDAIARSATLELMPQAKSGAEEFAKSKKETTKAIDPVVSISKSSINVERPDGTLVPLSGPEDLNAVITKGVNAITTPSPQIPTVTPSVTPITISPQLIDNLKKEPVLPANKPVSTNQQNDEDVLLTEKLLGKKPNSENAAAAVEAIQPSQMSELSIESKILEETRVPSATPNSTRLKSQFPLLKEGSNRGSLIQTDTGINSQRSHNFFNTKKAGGNKAIVFVMNSLDAGIVTVSIIPQDEKPTEQAILMPGESKTIQLIPDTYNFQATVSSNDYPPITLMDTQFTYQFQQGMQYSRRFDRQTAEKLN